MWLVARQRALQQCWKEHFVRWRFSGSSVPLKVTLAMAQARLSASVELMGVDLPLPVAAHVEAHKVIAGNVAEMVVAEGVSTKVLPVEVTTEMSASVAYLAHNEHRISLDPYSDRHNRGSA